MAIIKQYHKDTDTTYVYESTSYWDPDKKQSRSKRKCIGKIDPATGEIVPTGKRGRKKKEPDPSAVNEDIAHLTSLYEKSRKEAADLRLKLKEQELELAELKKQLQKQGDVLNKIQSLTTAILS